MTNEEMQQTMAFILEQQAKASAKLDALIDAQKEVQKHDEARWKANDERWTRSEERWTRTEEGIRALLSIAEIHEREIAAQGQQILSLGEQTRATDERLNALITVVERHISEGRNGKP